MRDRGREFSRGGLPRRVSRQQDGFLRNFSKFQNAGVLSVSSEKDSPNGSLGSKHLGTSILGDSQLGPVWLTI